MRSCMQEGTEMSEEALDRPFTAEELDKAISVGEIEFRRVLRGSEAAFQENNRSECVRLRVNAAEISSILAELRYQRERIS